MAPSSVIGKCVGFLLCLACSHAFSQTGSIKGRILDASTREPLPFSNVFINNTTMGASADADGKFVINNVSTPGVYELIASFVGYESYSTKINITDSLLTLRPIFLKPSEVVLSSVEVKSTRDKSWEKKLSKFSKVFLGTDKQADKCTIVNPWVIDFPESDNKAELKARAIEPIEIENKALGYKVKFYLADFSSTPTAYKISGKTFFEDLTPASYEERDRWRAERERSYRNSKQYFFKCMVERRLAGAGFKVFREIAKGRSNQFYIDFGKTVVALDTLTLVEKSDVRDTYGIRIKGRMEVHYMGDKDNSSIYRDVLHPISWIELRNGFMVVNKDGFELNTSETFTDGAMSRIRISRLVPINYKPEVNVTAPMTEQLSDIAFLEEKIYVQTDKPYYYPHETMWFKGYLRYRTPSLRDSLSRTLYAELIGPSKEILSSKTLEISNGSFRGEFDVPDSAPAGDYFLRCYTNLNRNFGDEKLFTKYIPVLDPMHTVEASGIDTAHFENDILSIISKTKFHKREKIDLTIEPLVNDPQIFNGSDLSISVTDTRQVTPLMLNRTIVDALEMGSTSNVSKAAYPVEYGLGFKGTFSQDGQPLKEKLLGVFQLRPSFYTATMTDAQGNFAVNGLRFYDSALFSFVPTEKNNGKGTALIFPRDIPQVSLPATTQTIATRPANDVRRGKYYKTDSVIVLDEVKVEAAPIRDPRLMTRPYGMPGTVVSGDVLRKSGVNLLMALQGQFPGLVVKQEVFDGAVFWLVYLRNRNPSRFPPQVQVAINGSLLPGMPHEILSQIDVGVVESVELSRGSSVFGGFGRSNGILTVYTKMDLREQPATPLKKVLIKGYQSPRNFTSPDYSKTSDEASREDVRSTIYWNPSVTLDEKGQAHINFYAADLSGKYHIIIEGTTRDGMPIRAEKTIEVD